MAYSQILVPLNGSEHDDIALTGAFAIASSSAAHVSALFVRPDARMATPMIGFSLFPSVIEQISVSAKQVADEAARTAHRRFTAAAIKAKIEILERPKALPEVAASFHESEGFVFECVSQAAKFADVVVFGPFGEPEDLQMSAAFADVLMTAKRPVLLTPRAIETRPAKIAIGWDGAHSTARAVCAAVPLLAVAQEVEILSVKRKTIDERDCDDLRDYLALSGIFAKQRIVEKGNRLVGECLLNEARNWGADLLVIGGYGHSPLREAVFGGTTAYAIADASMPIFLVH